LVCLVGEAQPPSAESDVLPVSANSPMGEALMKARVGDTVKVKAPRGTMEFKILEILE
jgi:transcription elongation GreA/GreB family factor